MKLYDEHNTELLVTGGYAFLYQAGANKAYFKVESMRGSADEQDGVRVFLQGGSLLLPYFTTASVIRLLDKMSISGAIRKSAAEAAEMIST